MPVRLLKLTQPVNRLRSEHRGARDLYESADEVSNDLGSACNLPMNAHDRRCRSEFRLISRKDRVIACSVETLVAS